MRQFIIAIGFCLLCSSCSAPHQIINRDDFLAEAIRRYSGESRERVIRAAETVLRISDPKDWDFRYTLNGFVGLRRYLVYAVLATQQGQEKWEFLADEDAAYPNSVRASVSISEAGVVSGSYSATPYEGKMASLPLYRLFWNRVDYMLRKRPDWVTCDQAIAELEKDNTAGQALSGLCGSTSDGRDASAPEPLLPIPTVRSDKKKPKS